MAVGVALLVAGGIFIFATNDQGEPPIAYWKFDEGSASTTVDSYNSLSNGTLTGGVQWVNGVYGTGLQFDGINDYVSGSDEIFPAGGSARTVSMWVKTGELPVAGSDPVFLKYGSSDFGLLFSLAWEITAGANQYKIMFTQMGSTAYSNSTLSPNTWYYITLTYPEDGIDSTFYINGKLDGSFSLGSNTELIGYTIGEGFSGIIDDVKIYNYVRTAGQVKNDYNKGKALYIGTRITDCDKSPADCVNKGLVGYWNMDEMGSTTAFDKSGNNNNGSLGAGVAAARPVWASGIQPFSGGRPGGGALSFDGVNDTVNCGNPSALYLNQAGGFTISAWV
ncbi:MAG: LamG domain-containing protein, partial [Candidatus Gribaldobacteria bacterium]|nr:LamG domain-containing protein [Candidatus Gribaldobacteria bacterium]